MQEAIRGEGLDGWLFCNFHHRDKLADEILGIDTSLTNSRPWVYAVPASGAEPLGIVHAIEPGILGELPGERVSYVSREDFNAALRALGGKRWGVHASDTLPAISWLDAGTAAALEKAGLALCSAAGLVQRFRGLLNPAGIASHERAGRHLYDIVKLVWERVEQAFRHGEPLREGVLRTLILDEMKQRGLETDHPPIVGAGINTSDPHYDFSGSGERVREGDAVQLDLWAKEAGGIYADISWAGVFAPEPSPLVEKAFEDLVSAREGAYRFIEEELRAGRRVSGAQADQKTREILMGRGREKALRHRTGHGIDTECHGSGVNIDSVEFPDPRPLLEGSCFSLEPGIYFGPESGGFGLRTEIDVYIQGGRPVISGGERQFSLLTCRR
jgi:Xaa-Pro aminopeptidase